MKKVWKLTALLLLICLILGSLPACSESTEGGSTGDTQEAEFVDYVEQLKLDLGSSTAKQEVTVKTYVDGDTVHFNVPTSVSSNGVLKARFLAINTPESTGKVEEYGKTASNFTKEKLQSAVSIIVESDDENWNIDSTGSRYLVWIWYKTAEDEDYRNLNVEILQNGLAIASNTSGNRYGDIAMAALTQAQTFKLNIYSGEKDPLFYYGDAVELTLRELRLNISDYEGVQVAFNGVVTCNYSNGVYVEAYDEETGIYFGMYVYYGFNLSSGGLTMLSIGNEVRVVGTVSEYNGTWQVSGLSYSAMRPDDPGNLQLVSEGNSAAYVLTDPATFVSSVSLELEEGTIEKPYAELALGSTLKMTDLYVKSIYTTDDETLSSYGAMTMTCEAPDGTVISIRTTVFYDGDGNLITEEAYLNKTIDVSGVVDYYNGYQVKVLNPNNITVHE